MTRSDTDEDTGNCPKEWLPCDPTEAHTEGDRGRGNASGRRNNTEASGNVEDAKVLGMENRGYQALTSAAPLHVLISYLMRA